MQLYQEQYPMDKTAQKPRSVSLIVLCVLTLVGNLFIIGKGILTYLMLYSTNDTRSQETVDNINLYFLIELLTCLGCMLGAVFMINHKKVGLTIYLVSTIAYIIITFGVAILSFLSVAGIIIGVLQFVYLIPSFLFLVLYIAHRRHLS